jgi:Protein of unknown function (DUF3551)
MMWIAGTSGTFDLRGIDIGDTKISCGETVFGRNRMRRIVLATIAFTALALTGMMPAQAVGDRHPFCLQGNDAPGLSNCTFDTYAQCMATASGRFLTCVANPYFVGESDDAYAYQNRGRQFPPQYILAPPSTYPRSRY